MSTVERLISEVPGYYPSMEEVAERMFITKRTLHRRIEKAGTTFTAILESARFRDAKSILKDTQLSVTQIGYLLGYNDSSNFSRAFRRRAGETPLQFRKRHLSAASKEDANS